MLDYLMPAPQELKLLDQKMSRPRSAQIQCRLGVDPAWPEVARFRDDLLDICGVDTASPAGQGTPVILAVEAHGLRPEGYRLAIREHAITLTGADRRGLFYGMQTLLQILALSGDEIEQVDILDWPALKTRELMLDLGRAPFSMPLLKRCIRIMARLKINTLHLHLFDDQLNSLRFDKLPLGSENPFAITLDQLRQIIAYARSYHVAVVPELECWGHAGSILYHYPRLYGAPGMWGGYSFGIGEELYTLLEQMLDEVVPVLDSPCDVHLGLDEAIWATLPSVKEADKAKYSPRLTWAGCTTFSRISPLATASRSACGSGRTTAAGLCPRRSATRSSSSRGSTSRRKRLTSWKRSRSSAARASRPSCSAAA